MTPVCGAAVHPATVVSFADWGGYFRVMTSSPLVATNVDLRSDAGDKDPDRYSPILRSFHRTLWSRKLPSGQRFTLTDTFAQGGYLTHVSELGTFKMSSDTIIRTFRHVSRMRSVIELVPETEREAFSRIGYTIGGMILFPRVRVDGKHTINQARGTSRQIEDRFDLTLECIRRHYNGVSSPLADVLARYASFFDIFESFRGYVDFFLLQDLVTDDGNEVQFFLPFNNFAESPFPSSFDAYRDYREASVAFVTGRNQRIDSLMKAMEHI
jgi:hypothetical protein